MNLVAAFDDGVELTASGMAELGGELVTEMVNSATPSLGTYRLWPVVSFRLLSTPPVEIVVAGR